MGNQLFCKFYMLVKLLRQNFKKECLLKFVCVFISLRDLRFSEYVGNESKSLLVITHCKILLKHKITTGVSTSV